VRDGENDCPSFGYGYSESEENLSYIETVYSSVEYEPEPSFNEDKMNCSPLTTETSDTVDASNSSRLGKFQTEI